MHTYNLQKTYIDDAYPWMGILAEATFVLCSTYHRVKGKVPGHMVFEKDTILPIMRVENWRYIRQRKQAQINKDVIRNNSTIIDHNYRVGDQVLAL